MNTPSSRRIVIALLVILAVLPLLAAPVIPGLNWRVSLVLAALRGQIVGVEARELGPMLLPGSPYYLRPLAETHNAFASIANPYQSPGDLAAGAALFATHCAGCHADSGTGGVGADLARRPFRRGDGDWQIFKAIETGIAGTAMQPLPLPPLQRWQIVAHVQALQHRSNPDDPAGSAAHRRSLPYARLRSASEAPCDWLTYSGEYRSHRFSPLDQINRGNVSRLALKWAHQFSTNDLEVTPLVVDGLMLVIDSAGGVKALDAASGTTIWSHLEKHPPDLPTCCAHVNRGVAVIDDRVIFGTADARLVALDLNSGRRLWSTPIADYREGYTVTTAPLALADRVIVGVAYGDTGIRGFLDAYATSDGRRLWRFNTVPGPGEAGYETWSGDSWKTGGAATWLTGSFDPELDLVYWGVGNPAPVHDGRRRLGDNLYSDSVIALRAATGELAWHFQFTPHDVYDWDANQIPVLLDANYRGRARKLMLWANRNAFYYLLDRSNGEFLAGTAYAKQNWARGLDSSGRPLREESAVPTESGTLIYPGLGATNWWSPSYSRATGLLYVPIADRPKVFFSQGRTGQSDHSQGELYMGGSSTYAGKVTPMIKALRPLTGETAWQYDFVPRDTSGKLGGLLSTAGGIVFGSDQTHFFALDATSGKLLWRVNTGGDINAAPVSYGAGGEQIVAIAAGAVVYAFALPGGQAASKAGDVRRALQNCQ